MAWHAVPIKAFALPYVFLGDAARWRYISVQGGVPFDRLRLSSLVSEVDADLLDQLKRWCDDFASKLPQSD